METELAITSQREQLIGTFKRVRQQTEKLCAPLAVDDYQLQSIEQTSPPPQYMESYANSERSTASPR